ncbi:hypothetical protein L4D76_23340 [Photobacterium sagamiensis]|uniref:hypothetical protein n=1 Tax=Photobacterium sagamiensis TaxID=2910241 RepID=UPI003D0EE550
MKIRFFLIAGAVLILPSSLFAESALNAAADDADKNLQQEVINLTNEKCPNPALEFKTLQKSSDVN